MTRAQTVIVGAGIAGLACATELISRGRTDLLVLEAGARAGGAAETAVRGAYTVERGPNTVRGNDALRSLASAVGLELIPGARAAPYLVSDGALLRLPPGPGALLSGSFLPWRGIASLLVEPFRPVRPGPRTVRALVEQRFGRLVAERFADLVTLGIYGAGADQVGFESAFPELADALEGAGGRFARLALRRLAARGDRPTRAGVVSTARGLGGLCEALAEKLGDRLRTSSPVARVRGRAGAFELKLSSPDGTTLRCENLVLAVSGPAAARLLDASEIAPLLAEYRSVPQTLVSFALEDPECAARWPGLGFLSPTRERLPLLGCLFPSNLFTGRAPPGSLLLSVFAAGPLRDADDATLARDLAPVLRRLLGAARDPELIDVAPHPYGIPLYDPGHRARTALLKRRLADSGGPILCGVGYDGVAFGAAAQSGIAAARSLAPADSRQ